MAPEQDTRVELGWLPATAYMAVSYLIRTPLSFPKNVCLLRADCARQEGGLGRQLCSSNVVCDELLDESFGTVTRIHGLQGALPASCSGLSYMLSDLSESKCQCQNIWGRPCQASPLPDL